MKLNNFGITMDKAYEQTERYYDEILEYDKLLKELVDKALENSVNYVLEIVEQEVKKATQVGLVETEVDIPFTEDVYLSKDKDWMLEQIDKLPIKEWFYHRIRVFFRRGLTTLVGDRITDKGFIVYAGSTYDRREQLNVWYYVNWDKDK